MTAAWTRQHLRSLSDTPDCTNVLQPSQTKPAIDDLYLWDLWPIRNADGTVPRFEGTEFWMALSAPRALGWGARHHVARIRLLAKTGTVWSDRGPVFADDAAPGSHQWAGSARYDDATDAVTVFYTSLGDRTETRPNYVQRIFETSSRFDPHSSLPFPEWQDHVELVEQGGPYKSTLGQLSGEPGYIKAFRDPFVTLDPATGIETLLFTASLAGAETEFDGAVGSATRSEPSERWQRKAPLIHADGVNNELERPHIVPHAGRYYLFFSTQAHTFHPDISGPTGVYGFVAESMHGDWKPLNGSGLVFSNPVAEPYQCYSWLVLNDLSVSSFVDMHTLQGRHPHEIDAAGETEAHAGGTPAPFHQIALDGDQARLVGAG